MSSVSSSPSRPVSPLSNAADAPPVAADTVAIAAAIRRAEIDAQVGGLDAARDGLMAVLAQDPEHLDALAGLAYLAMRRDAYADASAWFDRALATEARRVEQSPAAASTQARIGLLRDAALTHQRAGDLVRSRTLLTQLAALLPSPENLLALAMGHIALQEYDAAQPLLERAIHAQPMAWELHYNLGRLLGMRGRYDDEIAAYRHALRIAPNAVPPEVNLGVALRDLHRFDEAMQSFKRAVQRDASSAEARTNRAQTNLMRGEFEHGWREYEWRWRDGPPTRPAFADDRNQWDGKSSLAGKTILLFAEQGFGDTMQFARLALTVAARQPGRLVLRVQAALVTLFESSPAFIDAGIVILSDAAPLPDFDVQAALMSLPHLLHLRLPAIPTPIPYLFAPGASTYDPHPTLAGHANEHAASAHAAAATARAPARRRIGLVWRGNPQHVNDHNRSIALAQWESLLRETQTDIEWLALHDRVPDTEAVLLQQWDRDGLIRDNRPMLKTFADTAREVATLDLVISVDSAVAHLAGAMGKTVWIVLPFTPDFRWLLTRTDTPWYPSARLFRQTVRGEWSAVFDAVKKALATV